MQAPDRANSLTSISGAAPKAMRKGLLAYFGGINRADYAAAWDAMGPVHHPRSAPLDGRTERGWVSSYDFNIRIRSVSKRGSTYRAWITFDSIFAFGRGPEPGLTCARWSMNYTFAADGSRLEINGNKAHGGGPKHQPC